MRDLRVLEVRGAKLKRLWQRESQAPVQLRELYIDAPLLEFPDSIRKLQNIEKIELDGSVFSSGQIFLAQLSALPEEFCDLRFSKYLDLKFLSLQFLPKYFGKLTNLQHIDLSHCHRLQTLTDSFGDLTNLREINLQSCTSLEVLPDSLENLKNLREINLQGCKSLETLPICIENLTNLKKINLVGCESLEELPNAFGTLTNPQKINLAGCKKLKMLPNSIVNLTKLEEINLEGCESLEMLPNALGSLTNLQYIYLEYCESLEQMPSNSLENLLQLKHLHLKNCHRLTISDQIFGNITSLECLDLSGCIQMEVLPLQVLHQQHLRMLNLVNTRIEELPSGPTVCLSNLEVLILGSPLLKVLPPWLGYLTSLKKLQLHGCKELNYLPDSVGQLAQLKELYIAKCGIHYLPAAVMKMKNLRTLGVRDCPLCELPFQKAEDEEPSSAPEGELDFPMETGMIELNEMHLHCTEISKVTFPEGACPNLHELKITQCHGLLEVGALPTALLHLDLRGCDALRKIGGFCDLVNLEDLDIRGCCALEVEELLGLETEISLDLLRIKKLRSLKKLKTAFQSYDSDGGKDTAVLHGDFCNHGKKERCTIM
jgi:Leucine-rich repeat (LRR) protein